MDTLLSAQNLVDPERLNPIWAWLSLIVVKSFNVGDPAVRVQILGFVLVMTALGFVFLSLQKMMQYYQREVDRLRVQVIVTGFGIALYNTPALWTTALSAPREALSFLVFSTALYLCVRYFCKYERYTLIGNPNWMLYGLAFLTSLSLTVSPQIFVMITCLLITCLLVCRPHWSAIFVFGFLLALILGQLPLATISFWPPQQEGLTLQTQTPLDLVNSFYAHAFPVWGDSTLSEKWHWVVENFSLQFPFFMVWTILLGMFFLLQQNLFFLIGLLLSFFLTAMYAVSVVHGEPFVESSILHEGLQTVLSVQLLPVTTLVLFVAFLGIFQLSYWVDQFSSNMASLVSALIVLPFVWGFTTQRLVSADVHRNEESRGFILAAEKDLNPGSVVITDSDIVFASFYYWQKYRGKFEDVYFIHSHWLSQPNYRQQLKLFYRFDDKGEPVLWVQDFVSRKAMGLNFFVLMAPESSQPTEELILATGIRPSEYRSNLAAFVKTASTKNADFGFSYFLNLMNQNAGDEKWVYPSTSRRFSPWAITPF